LETVNLRFCPRSEKRSYPDGMDDPKLPKHLTKERRSRRVEMNVPVVVHRPAKYGPLFYESTQTLVINAHGALIPLTDKVAPKQRLLVQNIESGEQQECQVVSVQNVRMGPPRVAVEFVRPLPTFWRIAFPPSDWNAT
jgi:hypothetical protein